MTATSACDVTVVVTTEAELLPSLLADSGSPVVDDALAELVKLPLAGALTVTVKLVLLPFARELMVGQATTPLLLVPLPLALTKVAFSGRVSLTTILDAVEGPRLVTVIV